ncbi:MAG: hypothetical protein WC346_05640 [Methanogenium sp.]|jgi:hypothetical protein
MKEQIVLFQTAKLAKESGFDIIPRYGNNASLYDKYGNHSYYSNYGFMNSGLNDKYISAPTQALLQKWIREEHNIEFVIKPFHDSSIHKTTYVADPIHIPTGRTSRIARQDSYEEALEKGLQEALNLI